MWDGGEEREPQVGGQLTGGQRKELSGIKACLDFSELRAHTRVRST